MKIGSPELKNYNPEAKMLANIEPASLGLILSLCYATFHILGKNMSVWGLRRCKSLATGIQIWRENEGSDPVENRETSPDD